MPVVSGCLYWIELLLLVLLLLLLTLLSLSLIQERKQEEKADDQMILSTVDINTLVDDNSEVVRVNCFHLL